MVLKARSNLELSRIPEGDTEMTETNQNQRSHMFMSSMLGSNGAMCNLTANQKEEEKT